MAKFKLGDKVRMDPFISGDHDQYVKFRNKIGTIVGVGTYEYDVTFPENPGEAYEFYEEELTRVKSLPTTDTKSVAHFEVGDKVRILPGTPESGKVGKIVAHPNEYEYDVVLEGENTPYPYEGHELTLAKSLPTTATKGTAQFKVGDKVLVLPGNYRSGKVGTVVAFQDGDPAVQLEGIPEPELFAEYELRLEKSLPATKALPQCSFCGKSLAGGSEVLEGSRRYHTMCFPSTSSVALRAKYIVRD